MKRVFAFLLAIIILFPNEFVVLAADVDNNDIITLENLIFEGETMTDTASPEAYVWVTKVLNFNEKYVDSYVYSDIESECISAKGYSSISTFNTCNKILGYLGNLKDELCETESKEVDILIADGEKITDASSALAYKWIVDVLKTNEKYTDSYVYSDIESECISAKGYSSISTFNTCNKILGYLNNLKGELDGVDLKSVENLITEGKIIDNHASAEAYSWLINVMLVNECYKQSSVYSDIKSRCTSAKGYSNISTFNEHSQILADLMVLKDEIPVSSVLQSIGVVTPSNKTTYIEGEFFDATGLKVSATYLNTYIDLSTDTTTKEVKGFVVDTTTKLTCDDTCWKISYTEGDITKTTTQVITVNPYIVSETLKSIVIAVPPSKTIYKEGEIFNKKGMKINATFDRVWSNGVEDIVTKEDVPYFVDTTTRLTYQDDSVEITVMDNGFTKTVVQGIEVQSYIVSTVLDRISIISNPIKTSYVEGETFNKKGLVVSALYKNEWSNGYIQYITKNNVSYNVNITAPLKVGDTKWTVSFIDNGVRKSVDIPITVMAINAKPNVDKVTSFKAKEGKGKLTLSWKSIKGAKGYQLQTSVKKNFSGAKITNVSRTKKSYVKKNLKSKEKYYIRIRAYRTYKAANGKVKKIYGKWKTISKKTK